MKRLSKKLRDFLVCVLIVVVYAALFQFMSHTRMIEKVMALNFSLLELILIVAFLVSRLLTYLLIPSVIVAVLVHRLATFVMRRKTN